MALPTLFSVRGIHALMGSGANVPQIILDDPRIKSVSLRFSWDEAEPAPGSFDWTYLANVLPPIKAAGKKAFVRLVMSGQKTPAWLVAMGPQMMTYIDDNPWHPTYGQEVAIPVFWDLLFLDRKLQAIQALGNFLSVSAYAHVKIVACSHLNAFSDDWGFPKKPEDLDQWLALGWNTETVLNVGKRLLDETVAQHPNRFISIPMGRSHNRLDPSADYMANALLSYAREVYPGRVIAQKNALSAKTVDPRNTSNLAAWQVIQDARPMNAAQMLWFVSNDATYRMNAGTPDDPGVVLTKAIDIGKLGYGTLFQELYAGDIKNATLSPVIDYAASMLGG